MTNKKTTYAIIGFVTGFICSLLGCGSMMASDQPGFQRIGFTSAVIISCLFAIVGAIIGGFADNPQDTKRSYDDKLNQLEKLSKLRDSGVLTEEEFNKQKNEIL